MKEKLIQTKALDNRLTLRLYDASRRMVADRWVVVLVARIDISVDALVAAEKGAATPGRRALIDALGRSVIFEQRRERKFVAAKDKERVLRELGDTLLSALQGYLSHPDFARRYVLSVHRRLMERRRLYAGTGRGGGQGGQS